MPIEVVGPDSVRVEINLREAEELAMDILSYVGEDNTVGLTTVAMVMALGRLMSPQRLDAEGTVKFIENAMDWLGCYFAEGGMN